MLRPGPPEIIFINVRAIRGTVNKADRNLLISVGVIVIVIVGGYASLVAYTGFTTPFSIIMSQSMQHDPHQSDIGSIDTGDIVLVMDPDKTEIYSYVEGTQNGYQSFGDYGSVIIYDRGTNQNPVIHRAIVWLEYNAESDTWSAPSLANYNGTWYCIPNDGTGQTTDWNDLRGTLHFEGITVSGKDVSINLDSLEKSSGYLTMGDNPSTNLSFDQPGIISHAVGLDDIESVPILEIPWLGTIKIMMLGGDNLEDVPNSLPSLIMVFVTIFGFLILIDGFSLFKNRSYLVEKLREVRQWKR